jgi:hypothetical protein
MLNVIRAYADGHMDTGSGNIYTGEYCQDWQADDNLPVEFRYYDFSSALYYWIPDNLDTGKIIGYESEKAVYED